MPSSHRHGGVARGVEDERIALHSTPRDRHLESVGPKPDTVPPIELKKSADRAPEHVDILEDAGRHEIRGVECLVVDAKRGRFVPGEGVSLRDGENGGAPTRGGAGEPRAHFSTEAIEIDHVIDLVLPSEDTRARSSWSPRRRYESEPP